MTCSLSYVLAAAIQELFPAAELQQIEATETCFFCDFSLKDRFSPSMLSLLEERMRIWWDKKEAFQEMEFLALNAVHYLKHKGHHKLAQEVSRQEGMITLLQLDRFLFPLKGKAPLTTHEVSHFKLVCFWTLSKGIRILGVASNSKDEMKEKARLLKHIQDPQSKLEQARWVEWVCDELVWQAPAELIKEKLKYLIRSLCKEFKEVFFATDKKEKILTQWFSINRQPGLLFELSQNNSVSLEPWDSSSSLTALCWGKIGNINSFLHIITKFLTIFSFDYEVVSRGKISSHLRKALKECRIVYSHAQEKGEEVEFHVRDQLGRKWKLSSLQYDQKIGLLQMKLCHSFERWIALMVDRYKTENIETLLNRLNELEN